MKILNHSIAMLLITFAAHVGAQSLKIGYVNGLRIENESAIAIQAIEQIKKEFAPREQQLQELQKQGSALRSEFEKEILTMSPADKQAREKQLTALAQQFQQMQRSLVEDLELRKREARARFLAEASVIIKSIAEAGKFDLIVQQAIYSSAQIDITDQVLKEMAKHAGSGAPPDR